MQFSISVSFTNKQVNHTVIFELKKLKKNNNNKNYKMIKMDELGMKLTGLVSSWNLDSGISNVPEYTTEIHGPLLAGAASYIEFFIGICISQNPILRRRSSCASLLNYDFIFHDDVI